MAKILNIELANFRNFQHFSTSFDNKLNILFGNNGCGKTNILESISLISKGTGLRNSKIADIINHKKENFLINYNLEIKKNIYDIQIQSEKKNNNYKKIIKINEDKSKDSLEFLNQSISYLYFLPEMERLFQSSPSYRRNFLDRLIFSSKSDYNKLINKYKKCILERIKILQNNNYDNDWLKNIEIEICELGLEIYKLRNSHLNLINENIINLNKINRFQFNVELKIKDNFYKTGLTLDRYISELRNLRSYDRQYGGTKIGPHRSDIIAQINNEFEAAILSTGQQKTVVLIILLAQCNYLVNNKKLNPILLLDEICSHLDTYNRELLLDLINRFDIQFFLTGTDKNLFSFISTNAQFYNITIL